MRDVPDLHVKLRRSMCRLAFVVVTALATSALVLALPIAGWIRGALFMACAVAGACELIAAWRCHDWRLTLGMDRRIVVESAGRERHGTVLDATYVTREVTCIVWREHGRRRSRVIAVPRDALPPEEHRQLRVWLRYSRRGAVAPEPVGASAGSWLRGDLAT